VSSVRNVPLPPALHRTCPVTAGKTGNFLRAPSQQKNDDKYRNGNAQRPKQDITDRAFLRPGPSEIPWATPWSDGLYAGGLLLEPDFHKSKRRVLSFLLRKNVLTVDNGGIA
jgi:hypothetical protein